MEGFTKDEMTKIMKEEFDLVIEFMEDINNEYFNQYLKECLILVYYLSKLGFNKKQIKNFLNSNAGMSSVEFDVLKDLLKSGLIKREDLHKYYSMPWVNCKSLVKGNILNFYKKELNKELSEEEKRECKLKVLLFLKDYFYYIKDLEHHKIIDNNDKLEFVEYYEKEGLGEFVCEGVLKKKYYPQIVNKY